MKFENAEVFNFEGAIRGLRFPMKSGAKADSRYCLPNDCIVYRGEKPRKDVWHWAPCVADDINWVPYLIGSNDMDLCQRMIKAGSPNDKYLRQILVAIDITAPLYWYKEMDTYKVGTVADSESTMHKLSSTPITLECFETDDYNKSCDNTIADILIPKLEELRVTYLETKDMKYWKELIRWLPESWLQKRHWTANYAVLRNIIRWRADHKLSEWRQFVEFCKGLPYAKELLFYHNKIGEKE